MSDHPFPIVIGMGGNLGDTRATFGLALAAMARLGIEPLRTSRLYWTRPWGVTEQPPFLNAAVAVKTPLSPTELLNRLHAIEHELGRRRTLRWGPRRLDLDLLLYGEVRLDTPELALPHPRLAERDFVLAPLIDLNVAPSVSLAPQGWKALLARIPPAERTIIRSEIWR